MRVVVADDSALFRRVLTEVLSALPNVEVVGQAPNGKIALQRVRELRPDLLTLDMEMPELDGLEVLTALKAEARAPAVIIVSALTLLGGQLTMQALARGAFDFITKPTAIDPTRSREQLRADLAPKLAGLELRLGVRRILSGKTGVAPARPAASAPGSPRATGGPQVLPRATVGVDRGAAALRGVVVGKPELVLIGVSTGGPNALTALLPALSGQLGVPILIVQHMPPLFTQALAESLAARCAIRVREAVHKEPVEPNVAYIAPGGRQMRLVPGPGGRKLIDITDDPPEHNCRPAVDYLFRSVAHHFPGRATAVILTGMGSDGALGARLLKRHGAFIIAQDEASCVVYGMPKAAVDAGVVDAVLPLESIAARLTTVVRGEGR